MAEVRTARIVGATGRAEQTGPRRAVAGAVKRYVQVYQGARFANQNSAEPSAIWHASCPCPGQLEDLKARPDGLRTADDYPRARLTARAESARSLDVADHARPESDRGHGRRP